jgi:hypothetical protein
MRATEPAGRGLPRLITAYTSLNSMLQNRQQELLFRESFTELKEGSKKNLADKSGASLAQIFFRPPIAATNPHDCNVDLPFPFVRIFSTQP